MWIQIVCLCIVVIHIVTADDMDVWNKTTEEEKEEDDSRGSRSNSSSSSSSISIKDALYQ